MADQNDVNILYSKVNTLSTDVATIKAEMPFLKDILERHTATDEKLSETLQEVQKSMVRMNEKMDTQSEAILTMRQEFEDVTKHTNKRIDEAENRTNRKIEAIDTRIDSVEDKGKFDIFLFVKQNWGWIMALIGIGTLYLSTFLKF